MYSQEYEQINCRRETAEGREPSTQYHRMSHPAQARAIALTPSASFDLVLISLLLLVSLIIIVNLSLVLSPLGL